MFSYDRRRSLVALAGMACGMPGASLARGDGQPWPSRPIRLIVPYGAGQGTDIFARLIGDSLARALGQPVVVENKVGANGMIGTDFVAKATPDGYTLLFGNSSATVMANALGLKTPYDLENDIVPVAQVGSGGVLLIARPDLPASNLKALVDLVRRQPGKYQYASWGSGSSGHLITEALKRRQGLEFDHVPYKTIMQITQDMMGGVIPIGWTDAASSLQLIRSGAIKPLAISGTKRVPHLPDLPTMAEQGYPIGSDGWYGVFAPTGVPAPVLERINSEVNRIMTSAGIKERLYAFNMANPQPTTPQEFARIFREDLGIWRDLAQRNGIAAAS